MISTTATSKNPKKVKSLGGRERYQYHITPAIKDNLWKARQKHEHHSNKLWHWKWDFLLQPDFEPKFRRESIDQLLAAQGKRLPLLQYKEFEKRTYTLKESPPMPIKSADVIGWRSTDKDNTFELFPTKPTMPKKICFRDEQYGVYRAQKYVMQDSQRAENEEKEFVPPRRTIVHKTKPLIC